MELSKSLVEVEEVLKYLVEDEKRKIPREVFDFINKNKDNIYEWKTSAHIRSASLQESAPTGIIINSWMFTLLSACLPPFKIFIIGTGNVLALIPPMYWYKDKPKASAAARAQAIETPRIALAPSLP